LIPFGRTDRDHNTEGAKMAASDDFRGLSPTTIADVLEPDHFMDFGIRPLWSGMPRVVGPAYPVRCAPGDNLMLHRAIYTAPAGSVICVEAGDNRFAVSGGNVCAVAQRNGVAAFVVDGVIRDLSEVREIAFPVFARGVVAIPGAKDELGTIAEPVLCGGVEVSLGDIIVADEDGVAVVPATRSDEILERATAVAAKDAATSLDSWEENHRARIDAILAAKGFSSARTR
jgi:4-hydroxy-4-methyl-2-oxoglutarate aldolase